LQTTYSQTLLNNPHKFRSLSAAKADIVVVFSPTKSDHNQRFRDQLAAFDFGRAPSGSSAYVPHLLLITLQSAQNRWRWRGVKGIKLMMVLRNDLWPVVRRRARTTDEVSK